MSTTATQLEQTDPIEPQVVDKHSWQCMAASFAAYTLDAMDWMILSLALPLIAKEFILNPTQMGLLRTFTLAGTALTGLTIGIFADRYCRVKLLGATMITYALFTALCGFVEGYILLLSLRFMTGLGLGGAWGVGVALVSDTWPTKRRAWATSVMQTGWPLGYGLAALAFMYIAPTWGWRPLFWLGIIPSFVAFIIMAFLREPQVWLKNSQWRKRQTETTKVKAVSPIKILFSSQYRARTIFASILASGAQVATWGINTFLATYLYTVKGLNASETGSFILLFNAGAIVGYQIFGYLSGAFGRRFSMGLGLLLCTLATFGYLYLDNVKIMTYSIPLFGLVAYGFFGTFGAYLSELYPYEARATGASFTYTVGRIVSMFSPVLVGVLATKWGIATGIAVSAGFNIIALMALMCLPETNPRKGK